MTYNETIDYINSLQIMGKKAGLENIKKLLDMMGNPQNNLKFVHIAGTNGKGSTTAMTASVLQNAGYNTGMYVSPFIINFRERIQINGEMISEQELTEACEYVKSFVDKMNKEDIYPTHFEIVTAIGMYYFNKRKCDIVVLEVGLGGRFDATNAITTTLISTITSISLDHTDLLGDTIAKIAFEKCGIIKNGVPVVSYPAQVDEAMQVIKEQSILKNSLLIMKDRNCVELLSTTVDGMDVVYNKMNIHIPFIGQHQIYNFITVMTILEKLKEIGFVITDKNITDGIQKTTFPARMEVMKKTPLVIIDGAHNQSGANALAEALSLVKKGKITVIMGMLADKDYHSAVKTISSKADKFIACTPNSYRALNANELVKTANQYCNNCKVIEKVIEAYNEVLKNADENDTILICGSLYLASEIRNYIINQK